MAKQDMKYKRFVTKYVPGVGILFDQGTTVPADGTADYAPGAIFINTDGSADANFYINQGSLTSSNFDPIDVGTILASNVPVLDTATWFTATNAETILAELGELLLNNAGTAALTGPSPLIWSKAPLLDAMLDPTKGFYMFDDFTNYGGLSLTGDASENGITFTERNPGSLANDPLIPGGVLILDSTANTVDLGATMQFVGMQCEPLTGTTMFMEWRAKVSEDGGQCFMGLCDDSITAPVDSNDAIVVNNHAGFYRDAGTGDADWTVGTGDGASTEEDDDAATSVKTTYHKYGMVISGIGAVAGSTVKFYFDGALVFTTTDINDMPLLLMCPVFQMDGDGTDQVTMRIDWMRILVAHATGLCRES